MSRTCTSARARSTLILVAVLLAGVVVGMAIERRGRTVSAQQAIAPGQPQAVPAVAGAGAPGVVATPTSASVAAPRARAVGEEAVYQELSRQYEQFHHINRTFEMVARAVSPAVVHIVARKSGRPHDDDPAVSHYEETGSGVIVRADRGRGLYVLTNNHVIDGAVTAEINIVLHDGRVLHPQRAWSDTKADIAVLRLGREDLPAARLGNSDEAAVGSWVMALGSPFGLTHSVSQGIISARGRHEDELQEEGVENQDFLQTDAAINPGNSGGPLVNMKGEVIGINTAIASNGGGSEGVGFSIPINLARWIMGQLVASGKVSRGAMGIDLDPALKHDQAAALGLDRPRGARVLSVRKPSPAQDAGLRGGDVILRFNNVDVIDLNHLINMVSMTPIGETVDLVIWRERKEVAKQVRIADQEALLASGAAPPPERVAPGGLLRRSPRPSAPGGVDTSASGSPVQAMGLELVTLDAASARRFGLSEGLRGVAVTKVEPTSPLAAYCRARDVIGTVDGQAVHTAEEVARALARRGPASVELGLHRAVNGSMQWRTVRVPR